MIQSRSLVDGAGNVYVADGDNHRVQKFTSNGRFLPKWGSEGTRDGEFDYPSVISVDGLRNVYVADRSNYRVQVFGPVTPALALIPASTSPPARIQPSPA